MSDLWASHREQHRKAAEPLAVRMRPQNLDEFAGQQHFLGPGKLLRRMLEADRLTSVIFYGPPGTGKTTLAELIARHTHRSFERANAASVGVKDVRHVLEKALSRLEADGQRTIFFLDEIHRFNKAQQDVLLGDVERGVITLIGATTENPFFAVNSALVSRSQVFQFQPIPDAEIIALLRRAIADEQRGYGQLPIDITDDALQHWATACDGDARRALSALEIAVESQVKGAGVSGLGSGPNATPAPSPQTPDPIRIDLDVAQDSIQQKAIVYDATGDEHYDIISAFIKSMRGSDPDATAYWLARMLHAGEDPLFIARRIAILASEDIGQADPEAIQVASAAWELVERIGMPEAQLTLAQAAIHMAMAPKSNATSSAIWNAMADVREGRTQPVPRELISGKKAGRAPDAPAYRSPHTADDGVGTTEYLGVEKVFYEPTGRGEEADHAERLAKVRARRRERRDDS